MALIASLLCDSRLRFEWNDFVPFRMSVGTKLANIFFFSKLINLLNYWRRIRLKIFDCCRTQKARGRHSNSFLLALKHFALRFSFALLKNFKTFFCKFILTANIFEILFIFYFLLLSNQISKHLWKENGRIPIYIGELHSNNGTMRRRKHLENVFFGFFFLFSANIFYIKTDTYAIIHGI